MPKSVLGEVPGQRQTHGKTEKESESKKRQSQMFMPREGRQGRRGLRQSAWRDYDSCDQTLGVINVFYVESS